MKEETKEPELFPETLQEPGTKPQYKTPEGMSCADCKHILSVQFNKRLFFCTTQLQHGGRFGKRIAKHARPCFCFKEARDEITVIDGYYGGVHKEIPRTKRRKYSK